MAPPGAHGCAAAAAGSPGGRRHVLIHAGGSKKGLYWITPDAPQSTAFRELGRDQQVVCLRAPASDPTRPPPTLRDLAVYHADSIDLVSPSEPVTLVGYCIAAVVAREVALEVQARGRVVHALIMIDPPDAAKSRRKLIEDPLGYRVAQQLRRWSFHLRKLGARPARVMYPYLRDSMHSVLKRIDYRRSGVEYAAAGAGGKAMSERFADSYHVAVAAFLNAVPAPYTGSAVVIRPTDVPPKVFEYANRRWRELISGGMVLAEVPGNSSTMWEEHTVKHVAEAILAALAAGGEAAARSG
jgi:thioesterase domain-containing protein